MGRKGAKKIIIILLFLFTLTGCWDRMEIGNVTFPIAMAIDREGKDGPIKLFVQISQVSFAQEGTMVRKLKTLEAEGETLAKALYRITDRTQQQISWKHTMVVALTEEFARTGVKDVLDILGRFNQIHFNNYLIVTPEEPKKLLEGKPEADIGIPSPLLGLKYVQERTSRVKAITLKDFFIHYLSEEQDNVIPRVDIYQKEQDGIELDFNGMGVFKEDRLVGWLSRDETRGMLWVRGEVNSGSVVVPCLEHPDQKISINPLLSRAQFEPYAEEGKIKMVINVYVEYNLIETTCPIKMNMEETKKVNQQVKQYIQNEIEKTMQKAQKELQADIFGFGRKIYRKYPDYWRVHQKDWHEIFKDMEYTVKVSAQLRRTGELSDSLILQ